MAEPTTSNNDFTLERAVIGIKQTGGTPSWHPRRSDEKETVLNLVGSWTKHHIPYQQYEAQSHFPPRAHQITTRKFQRPSCLNFQLRTDSLIHVLRIVLDAVN